MIPENADGCSCKMWCWKDLSGMELDSQILGAYNFTRRKVMLEEIQKQV